MIRDEAAARAWLEAIGLADGLAIERIETFIALLREENARQNLVSAASLDEVWRRHIVDSAQLLTHVPRETRTWLDLGTGAGFPGLIAAILLPECGVHLVESRRRRIDWLAGAAERLGLVNVVIHGTRLEQLESFSADVISARAFAPLDRLIELSARFSTPETIWLLPKGRSARQELESLRGWRHAFHVERSLTDDDAGVIVGALLGRKGKSV